MVTILIIGGTRFLGRHIIELGRRTKGFKITYFHRGKTDPGLFPNIDCIYGDRNKDLEKLKGNKWDAVVDTCGYFPGSVKKSAEYLKNMVQRYLFISTISVYNDFSKSGISEKSELSHTDEPNAEKLTNENYGTLKVLCEKAVHDVYGKEGLIIRPGLIVGPYDPSDRFTYWPVRTHVGGEVMAPSPPSSRIQFIDARDLAAFVLLLLVKNKSGIYNATGPEYELTMKEFLQSCNSLTGNRSRFTWVSEEFIAENKLDLPVWVPGAWAGINQVDCGKALKDGMRIRPLSATIRDTLKWHAARSAEFVLKAGLKPEIEKNMLEKWHRQNEQAP
jgi:2'-hydroxyisoflavone reductase